MDALDIRTIFGQDRRHIVPLFQRPYVWNRTDQWEPLWDDVRMVAERILTTGSSRTHFLGAIVLEQMTTPYGKVETRLVVDGQQRLTTIQLLLESFADSCGALGLDRQHRALVRLTRNDDPMSTDPDEVFKVWPTNTDRDQFRKVMEAETPDGLRQSLRVKAGATINHPIGDAYLYFYEQIHAWLSSEDNVEGRVDALLNAVQRHLRLVVIDLDKEDDAQLIFETLNARGTPLLPSDLIKNLLFHKAQINGLEIETLYGTYWQSFDDNGPYWREELGRGHARRARIDLFMQNFLSAAIQDEIPVGHLYVTFARYSANQDSQEILKSLKKYAEIYRYLDGVGSTTTEVQFLYRLRAMDMESFRPFLLELYSRFGDQQREIDAILSDIESFIVRRVVCQLTARSYGRLVVDLLKELVKQEGTPSSRIRTFLLRATSEAGRWPDDQEFRQAWTQTPIFRVLVKKRTRVLLEAIEQKLLTPKSERITFDEKLTVEHLMPQNWKPNWPMPEGENRDQMQAHRDQMIHTIGNLTLLNDKLNPAVSNSSWQMKLDGMRPHTRLRMNIELFDIPIWDETSILNRSERMFEIAANIWPRPQE